MHVFLYVRTYLRVYEVEYVSIYACMYNLCVLILVYVCMYGCIWGLFYKSAHVCMCVCTYVCLCKLNERQSRYDAQSHRDCVSKLPTGYSWLLLIGEDRVLKNAPHQEEFFWRQMPSRIHGKKK